MISCVVCHEVFDESLQLSVDLAVIEAKSEPVTDTAKTDILRHKDDCSFARVHQAQQRFVLRTQPLSHELQLDYTAFKRGSFYLRWEQDYQANYSSYEKAPEYPLMNLSELQPTLQAEALELLWGREPLRRGADEYEVT